MKFVVEQNIGKFKVHEDFQNIPFLLLLCFLCNLRFLLSTESMWEYFQEHLYLYKCGKMNSFMVRRHKLVWLVGFHVQGGLSAAPARAVSAVKNMNLPEIPRNINIGDINIKVPSLSPFWRAFQPNSAGPESGTTDADRQQHSALQLM